MGELITISNDHFTAVISTSGAELKSVKDRNGKEFMWQADPDIWPRTAPVLFPVVGKVKKDLLRVNDQTYPMSQHGFARDRRFNITDRSESSVTLQLLYDEETLQKYPFDFKLLLSYTWEDHLLVCRYEVHNLGARDMFFGIGAHPGFNISEGNLDDYVIRFSQPETLERHLLTDGLFDHTTEPVISKSDVLPLNKELFDKDAIVFMDMKSEWVELRNTRSTHAVRMDLTGFPYFAIWTKKGTGRFVCLEPWYGIADFAEGHKDICNKPGIRTLASHDIFKAAYSLSFTA